MTRFTPDGKPAPTTGPTLSPTFGPTLGEDAMFDRTQPPASTSAASAGSPPAERVMRIAPIDLKQQRFRTQLRGFDRTEVVAFLTEAADDYENALREVDRLRQDLMRQEGLLAEHREREANLRNTLLTAQRLADEI